MLKKHNKGLRIFLFFVIATVVIGLHLGYNINVFTKNKIHKGIIMWNKEVEEIDLEVPWGKVALKCWNSAESKPILVTHGLCENAGAFDRLIPLLPKQFFYVVVDLPGHGRSSPFPKGLPLDFMNYINLLQRVIEHFRWDTLTLMGHSFGGHLFIFLTAGFAKKIEQLILLEAVSPTPVAPEIYLVFHANRDKDLMDLERRKRGPTVRTYEEALTQMIDRRMSRLNVEAAKSLLERCLEKAGSGYVFTTDPRLRTEIRPAIGEDVIFHQLQRIKCPVLVILAKESEYFWLFNSPGFYADAIEKLRTTHEASSVISVPGNHCVHNNQPEIIAPVISRFLLRQQSKF